MSWTPEQVKALRLSRKQNQTDFASALGVDRVTVSRWEGGIAPVSDLNAQRLDALASGPRDTSQDYWRGVLYAAEAMSETVTRLLREARRDTEATITRTASAALAGSPPVTAATHPESHAAGRRTARPSRTGRDV